MIDTLIRFGDGEISSKFDIGIGRKSGQYFTAVSSRLRTVSIR